ncbi:hypothetical protein GS934_08530, partial [Rhodococcus hoagii]|nr:hypothetical protein [Prescottella equi]NKZ87530.1 hypothetical protein [Prescottella equi]
MEPQRAEHPGLRPVRREVPDRADRHGLRLRRTKLTAATAAAGGLGIIAGGMLSYDELEQAIHYVKDRTDASFGVNLRANQEDIDKRLDLLIRSGSRWRSFALAPQKRDLIAKLKDAGLVGGAVDRCARRHAEKVAEWGVEAVVVQGGEGGGHTGAVPTSLLLPQVVDAVDIRRIAGGRLLRRPRPGLGPRVRADGIAMGTRFMLTSDSPVAQARQGVYLSKSVNDTVVPSRSTGFRSASCGPGRRPTRVHPRPQRVLRAMRNAV